MKREAFIKQLRKDAKQRGLELEIDKTLGKGSHYRITVGSQKTTLKSGEITPLYAKLVRKQLGL